MWRQALKAIKTPPATVRLSMAGKLLACHGHKVEKLGQSQCAKANIPKPKSPMAGVHQPRWFVAAPVALNMAKPLKRSILPQAMSMTTLKVLNGALLAKKR